MLSLIVRKEIREFARDGRMIFAGGLMLILLVTAIVMGWQQQSALQAERSAGQALDYQAWLDQGPRHPHTAADQGMHVFKPQPPLSLIDPGIDPYVGSTIWLRGHRQSETKFRPAQDATGLQRFGGLSAAWILQILVPLLVIILGFGTFAGEREQGTLRQLLSLGVPLWQLLWGKVLAIGTALTLLMAPGALVAAAASLLTAEAGSRLDVGVRLLLMGLGYSLYLGATIFLVVAVSAVCRSARASLFWLLALWMLSTLIAPRVIADVSGKIYPTPTRMGFEADMSHDLDNQSAKAWKKSFGVESAWDPSVPLNKWGKGLQVDDHAGYGVLDQHFGKLWDTFERQQQVQEVAGLVAPVVAVRAFSMAVAGTDFSQHRDFSAAAERQRRVIQETVSHDLIDHADPLGNQHFSYKAGSNFWAKVPPFRYSLPTFGFALQRHWPSLAALMLTFCASLAFAWVAVTRRLTV